MANDKNKPVQQGGAQKSGNKPAPSKAEPSKATPPRAAAPRANSNSGGMTPAGRQQAESLGFLAMAAGVLIALNILGIFVFQRIDATRNRAYSLADGSRRVVSELDETLTVTAYFSADLPAPFNATERYVRDILQEYENASGGHMHVRFVSPDEDDEREEAERAGIQLVQHQHIENDSVSVVEGYRGVVFEYLGNREVIAVIQPDTEGLEYEITTTIRELTGEDMPIGILSGHEGPTPTKGLQALERMLPSYSITEVSATEAIDPELRALLIIEPTTEITDAELRNIDQYVMQGGSLGVFGGHMRVDVEGGPELSAAATGSNLNTLLEPWGIGFGDGIVADVHCGRIPMPTSMGLRIPVPYPPAPMVSFTEEQAEHPALFRLNDATLFFVTPIETTDTFRNFGDGAVTLMRSSETTPEMPGSWLLEGESVSLRIREGREWLPTTEGAPEGPFALAVALETNEETPLPSAFGEGEASGPVRVLVVGSASMLRDEFLGPVDQIPEADLAGAMAFPLNAIDWLSQDSDLIAIRAKTIEEPQLEVPQSVRDATEEVLTAAGAGEEDEANEALERRNEALESWDSRKSWFRWANTLLIPLAVAIFGVIRWQMRQRKKATLRA
jgi:ABC-type uncharacterized transport system involved in gliding motility auxiliary subunit